jgi:hypothetical protein
MHVRRGSWLLVGLTTLVVVLSYAAPASAYTWMIRHGYGGCPTCHADPSGGELLTAYGRVQSDLVLSMQWSQDNQSAASSETSGTDFDSFDAFDESASNDDEAAPPEKEEAAPPPAASEPSLDLSGFLFGLVTPPSALLIGGSFRYMNILQLGEEDPFDTFPMQMDLYGQLGIGTFRAGGSIGAARVPAASPHARAAQVTTGQGDSFNLISRTHYFGFEFDRSRSMLRLGRLNLPFGVRIPEHTMWVREATVTDRESDQQHGIALSYNETKVRAEGMLIAGNYQIAPDEFRERGYALYIEGVVSDDVAVGLSSKVTKAQSDPVTLEAVTRQAHGPMLRTAFGEPLVVLAEADVLLKTDTSIGYVGFVQGDIKAVQGLHFLLTGEILDAGALEGATKIAGLGKPRFGGWVSAVWYFYTHFDFRLDLVARQQAPLTILAQLHLYL